MFFILFIISSLFTFNNPSRLNLHSNTLMNKGNNKITELRTIL